MVDLLLEQPVGTGSKHNLDRVAGAVVRRKGVDFVYDVLNDSMIVESVDKRLKTLSGLPWKRLYTTNYDNALEVARLGAFPVSSVTFDDSQNSASLGSIIHLNGYIKRVHPNDINRGLVLTDASYAAARMVDTGWLSFFEHDLKSARAVIFAGYSLNDLDIDEVILESAITKEKAYFFVSPDADEIEVSTLERYGTVVPGGIDVLISEIQRVSSTYVPPRFVSGLTALREVTVPNEYVATGTAASKVFEQFVYGRIPEIEVLSGELAFGNRSYLVDREQDQAAMDAIVQGPWRDILFVGEMCSGKSASTLTLSAKLRGRGYRVYYAEKREALLGDLRLLAEFNDKVAVIFDGYAAFRSEIADYAARRPSEHRIILTERAALHEVLEEFITRTPHLGPVREVVLDRLAPNDVAAFEDLTNFGGFWGDRAGASIATRQRLVSDFLDGSLYRLLVEIIRSERVQAQIKELLDPISANRPAAKVFCSALIVNALGFEFTISEWQYLFDRSVIRNTLQNYQEQIRHFVSSDVNHIYIRSGVLSFHILHGFLDDELVRQCLVGLYERAKRSSNEPGMWRDLTIELTKFSSIEPMFSGSQKAQNIFQYYDDIRVYGNTVDNPDYWLQVGIASTVMDDLARGDICFKNAYARERSRLNPNLTRIDNYSARFDMRRAVAEADPDQAFALFINANARLVKQIFLDNNRHYPFKTGRHFSDVAAKHYHRWKDNQKRGFVEATKEIREKAREWKANKKEHSADVEILIKETTQLLRKLESAA